MDARRMPALAAALAILLAALGAAARAQDDADRPWVEALYREFYAGDLGAAVKAYEDFQARFPRHARAAEALLRSAACREKSGDLAGALALARRVADEYPRSAPAASRAEEILQRLEGQEAWESERAALARENDDLKVRIAGLLDSLDDAAASMREGARDEAERLREIDAMKGRIEELQAEKARLEERLRSHIVKRDGEEELSPEERLRRLEIEFEARLDEKRYLAEHYFRIGIRLQAEERLEEARTQFQKSLEYWDEHPKAREHLLQVGALLGDPESIQKDMLRRLEIQKEVRLQERKQELAKTLRTAFDFYRARAFDEAEKSLWKALDILVRDLPESPDFEAQKDLATRYIRMCQKESKARKGGPAPGAFELRLRAFAVDRDTLRSAAAELALAFTAPPAGGFAAAAPGPGRTAAVLERIVGRAAPLLDERALLVPDEGLTLARFLPAAQGDPAPGVTLVIEALFGEGPRRAALRAEGVFVLSPPPALPGAAAPRRDTLVQALAGAFDVPIGGALLLAGLRNPFPAASDPPGRAVETAEDLLLVLEGGE